MKQIILVANNIRSTFNVGSLFRTAEGLGIQKVYLCGYTPYPMLKIDQRLPHIAEKLDSAIHKTALGAEHSLAWEYSNSLEEVLNLLRSRGYTLCALEQSENSIDLTTFKSPDKVALVVGEEVNGLSADILKACDKTLEIPMFGKKESYNVSVATAMALYQLRFT